MRKAIRKFAIDNRIRIGYGSAFFLLLVSYLLTLYANRELLEQTRRLEHTNYVIRKLDDLLSLVKDAEGGIRGFIAIKDQNFLEPYYSCKTQLLPTFRTLSAAVADNPSQLASLDETKKLIDEKMEILDHSLNYFPQHGFQMDDLLREETIRGKNVMDRLKNHIRLMQAHENFILEQRTNELSIRYNALNRVILVSVILALILLALGFVTYLIENRARRRADERVFSYQAALEERVRELDAANRQLKEMRNLEKIAATGRIARTIAHEVRNPLTNINLAMEQLRSDMNNGQHETLFDLIGRNSNRINQLITDLLDSTKFSELKQMRVPINRLLDEVLEMAGDRVSLNHIRVVKNYSRDMCDVSVDQERIKIAFLNLVVNAIEAMEPGKGVLTINTREELGKCVIEIRDNGSGMDEEAMSQVFEPYFTLKKGGNGLGLTHSQNIILNHKGTIQVTSKKGRGTCFTIYLDFAESHTLSN